MSSGYEWATSTESFLAATSGRRGVSITWSKEAQPTIATTPSTPGDVVSFDMEIFIEHSAMDEVKFLVGKRKNMYDMAEHTNCAGGFKRARLQW